MFEKPKSKLKLAQEEAEKAINKTNKKIEELGEKTGILYDELTEIQTTFDMIRNIPSEKKIEYEELKKIRLDWKQQAEKIAQDFKDAEAKGVGVGAAGAGVGVAVMAMGPTVAMGVATTFGVASTGTAISSLSGAAATNAALAWLGGGALTAGGGGMAAGEALLGLAGPVGWAIAGVAILASGIMLWKIKEDKEHLESVFITISQRDVKSYELAIVELNERINRIIDESAKLKDAIVKILTFGTDYNTMTEEQQYELGSYVNLMFASTQLLINPIMGIQPKYSIDDYKKYYDWNKKIADKEECEKNKNLIISLANFLYKIDLNERDKRLLWKSLRENKQILEQMHISKKEFDFTIFDMVDEALEYKNAYQIWGDSEKTKTLLIVYRESDEAYFKQLKDLIDATDDENDAIIGVEDGSVRPLKCTTSQWYKYKDLGREKTLADKILFIDDSVPMKLTDIYYDKYGISYGIIDEQQFALIIDEAYEWDEKTYSEFQSELKQFTDDEKISSNAYAKKKELEYKLCRNNGLIRLSMFCPPAMIALGGVTVKNLSDAKKNTDLIRKQMLSFGITKVYLEVLDRFMKS